MSMSFFTPKHSKPYAMSLEETSSFQDFSPLSGTMSTSLCTVEARKQYMTPRYTFVTYTPGTRF